MNYLDTLPEEIIDKIYFEVFLYWEEIHKTFMKKIINDLEIPFTWLWFHSENNPKRIFLQDDKYNI